MLSDTVVSYVGVWVFMLEINLSPIFGINNAGGTMSAVDFCVSLGMRATAGTLRTVVVFYVR